MKRCSKYLPLNQYQGFIIFRTIITNQIHLSSYRVERENLLLPRMSYGEFLSYILNDKLQFSN